MPAKLSTTIGSISSIPNLANSALVHEFYQYMKSIGTSENYQNVNLKIIIYFSKFLGPTADAVGAWVYTENFMQLLFWISEPFLLPLLT
jgi:hypothetical protein